MRVIVASGEVSRKGDISELTNNTLFFFTSISFGCVPKRTVYKINEKNPTFQNNSFGSSLICSAFGPMKLFYTRVKWAAFRSDTLGSWGFVPTMGALHQGHLDLVAQARLENTYVAVSIYVNPKQFNQTADLLSYPKTIESDLILLQASGVDAVFIPVTGEVYPENDTFAPASPGHAAIGLEGVYRPGHFQGVVDVVDRLFDLIKPSTAYFGQKDLQQCLVVQEFASLKYPSLNLVTVTTRREASGLAMSSRNVRLSDKGREDAAEIFKVLDHLKEFPTETESMRLRLLECGIETEYLEPVEVRLNTQSGLMNRAWVFAGYIEGVRLIDSLLYQVI